MDDLQKLCQRNEKALNDIENHIHKQSHQALSIHEKDSISTNYR
jgi:hypothetical protein